MKLEGYGTLMNKLYVMVYVFLFFVQIIDGKSG
jgi:hypothetical protein